MAEDEHALVNMIICVYGCMICFDFKLIIPLNGDTPKNYRFSRSPVLRCPAMFIPRGMLMV